MEPGDFYQDASLQLQRTFGTEKLAAHLARRYVFDRLADSHSAWISGADEVYVATVNSQGQPECSYKGGMPGFIKVCDPRRLEIPSYDGNGMYRTLGNVMAQPRVGLLFMFPEVPAKLRINGVCRVLAEQAAVESHTGAEAVMRIDIGEVFENCPRYLHDRVTGQYSVHCPRLSYQPPEAAWKQKPEYEGLLRSKR